jgi:mannose-1-phosphate guanylyltransferase
MENNFCIIMAGGVGSRFWPFSRNEKPKQFLDFFGTGRSLLQLTYDRLSQVVPAKNILIVSNVLYKDLILEQLPELDESQILLEPARRNTAPCIAYAVNRIKSITKEANIIVSPADHLILKENEFINTLREGIDFVSTHESLLTLGIKPSRPETGYGYIQVAGGKTNLRKVKTFTEKPNAELANIFFETGEFFWNAGIFLWSLKSIDQALGAHLPEIATKFELGRDYYNTAYEQSFIDNMYQSCPSISIDYGLMEKASNVYVLCADFGWTDLGTWGSLYDISEKDDKQNATLKCNSSFYNSKNNVVVLPKEKLAVIEDLDGYIIVESDNVLLICKRDNEQQIRQYVNDIDIKYGGKYN